MSAAEQAAVMPFVTAADICQERNALNRISWTEFPETRRPPGLAVSVHVLQCRRNEGQSP
jgi:hypothetical protein